MSLADEILYGTTEGVAQYIKQGADVNEIDEYGFTPLIEAAIVNNTEVTALLIDGGAKVNEKDLTGGTALQWSVDNGNLKLSRYLLDKGADPNSYSKGGQPILVYPLLREQTELKRLLYQYGANLNFAQDYINTKLIGHRHELVGQIDLVNSDKNFIEVDYEGFFLEVTVDIIQHSLSEFKNNFVAKELKQHFTQATEIIHSLFLASELLRNQHHTIKLKKQERRLKQILSNKLLCLPIGYDGHVASFVKYGELLAVIDRGEKSQTQPSVIIYHMSHPGLFNYKLLVQLMYEKPSKYFIEEGFVQALNLQKLTYLEVPSQISGNCSWANVEAIVPASLFLMMLNQKVKHSAEEVASYQKTCLDLYQQWRTWDKDFSLHKMVTHFYSANVQRRASIASVLGAILFQRCKYDNNKDIDYGAKICNILNTDEYKYVLQSYASVCQSEGESKLCYNYKRLLDIFDVRF